MNNNIPALIGGKKTRKSPPFKNRKTMSKEEKNIVNEVMDSDILSAFIGGPGEKFLGGEKVKSFENKWKNKYGFKHAISVNSWTSGLIICCGAVGLKPGDEVICSPYSMSASATSVMFYGAKPVFADIDSKSYNISIDSIEKNINKNTKAILLVHIFGQSCDMDPILELAKKYNLKIIEDAAQSPGIYYKNKAVGAIGDIGGFSLNFHKHIHTGEGGMIVTNDDDLALKCQLIRNHGENFSKKLNLKNFPNIIGGNYRLTEIQAAIGIAQLDKLDNILQKRIKLANFLHNQLKEIDGLDTYMPHDYIGHAYYIFPIKFNEKKIGIKRSIFVKAVNAELPDAEGWESVPLSEGYVEPLYLNPIYKYKLELGKFGQDLDRPNNSYSKGDCPVTEEMYYNKMIITPLVREPLTEIDLMDLIIAIKKIIGNVELIKSNYKETDVKIFTPVDAASSKNVR